MPVRADVTDSLACLTTNDGTLLIRQSGLDGIDTSSDAYLVGDAWDWIYSFWFATMAYVSFPVATVPPGQRLASATLRCYVIYCEGNSNLGQYPVFDYPGGSFAPHCLLTHVDYGYQIDASDIDPVILHPALNLFNSYLPGWNEIDVTACVADDIQAGRQYTQFQIKLQQLSDWDGGDDYVYLAGAAAVGYHPWLELEFAPLTAMQDDLRPAPRLSVYPNPSRNSAKIELTAAGARSRELVIYNQRGQRVRSLTLAGADIQVEWDGKDDSGLAVAPGLYLLRLSGSSPTLRLVKLP